MEKNINEMSDIDKLKISFGIPGYGNKSNITGFYEMDRTYKWTNELMKLYPEDNFKDKKILTITGSGDHALEAILNGARKIDSIDINIFSKHFSQLKIAMIKKYEHIDFFRNIYDFTKENLSSRAFNILNEVSEFLTPIKTEFWNAYLNLKKDIHYDLFMPGNSGSINKYYREEVYNDLKDKINDVNITYYDGDIINASNILKEKKYDYIYLSNILDRIIGPFKADNYIKQLVLELINILNNDGIIYNYMFFYEDFIDKILNACTDFVQKLDFKNYKDIDECESVISIKKK